MPQVGDFVGDLLPHWVNGSERVSGKSSGRGNGRARGETFEAIAVDQTDPGKAIAGRTPHPQVTHFRVKRAVQRLSVDHDPAADASADRQVDMDGAARRGTLAPLRQRGARDIRIERDWSAEAAGDSGQDIGA